jgi:hypothetical protein
VRARLPVRCDPRLAPGRRARQGAERAQQGPLVDGHLAQEGCLTPELDAAHRAFERGDFRESRRLASELERSATDEPTRAAAHAILQRTSLDPLIVWLSGGCLVFFVLVIVLSVGK